MGDITFALAQGLEPTADATACRQADAAAGRFTPGGFVRRDESLPFTT